LAYYLERRIKLAKHQPADRGRTPQTNVLGGFTVAPGISLAHGTHLVPAT
jgi:hypothetical protein